MAGKIYFFLIVSGQALGAMALARDVALLPWLACQEAWL